MSPVRLGRHPDARLVERLEARDEDAARELCRAMGPRLYAFARRMLGDDGLAEDVVQETLIAALRSAARFDGRVAFSAWVFGIHRNKVRDALRRAGRPFLVSGGDQEVERFTIDGRWADGTSFPDWGERAELLDVVRRCLENLPYNQREALHLRAVEGLPPEEVARALGWSSSNLRQMLHRARQAVRRCVDQHLGARS